MSTEVKKPPAITKKLSPLKAKREDGKTYLLIGEHKP